MSDAVISAQKPRLPFLNILIMCFGFFGIQMGFALQTGHFSRVFSTLGAEVDLLPLLWIAGPVTGLIIQPIVGYFSDRTWTRLGRRRPYFLWGAMITTLGLFVMPSSPALWMAAGMLWIIDSSLNLTMEPFRAYVGDMLPEEQRTTGYAAQSFFIGIGGTLGSALPWLLSNHFGLSNEPEKVIEVINGVDVTVSSTLPQNIQMTFYIGATLLFIAVAVTVFLGREYDPETLSAYEAAEAERRGVSQADLAPLPAPPSRARLINLGLACIGIGAGLLGVFYLSGIDIKPIGNPETLAKLGCETPLDAAACAMSTRDWGLYVLSGGVIAFGVLQLLAGLKKTDGEAPKGMFSQIMEDMFRLPKTMRQLAVVQFFSWFAMFSMWIYLNDGAITHHYGDLSPGSKDYQAAGDWIGLLNGVYFAVAAAVAFLIPPLAKLTSRKLSYSICLLIGALGFSSFIWLPSGELLWISMIGVGIVWAAILSMPYAILSNALPAQKMGIYMGIFNFFIVIPQMLAATLLGLLVSRIFDGYAMYALGLGAVSFTLAAVAVIFVTDPGDARRSQ